MREAALVRPRGRPPRRRLGRIDVNCDHAARHGRRGAGGPDGVAAVPRPRRREPRRRDGDGGAAVARRRARRDGHHRREWTAHVPRTFARTGAIGHFFFIAQWFPKLGVLQDEGWNCHQFHAGTEFFSDYGVYDVSLTVPRGWVVGATGVEREARDNGDGTTTHRFYQEDVHDFAWTTSPDFVVRTARFEAPDLPPVEMRLLLQPEHAGQAGAALRRDASGAQGLRRVVRPVPVRAHHDRRSGLPERRGRHGVPDAVHGRHAVALAPEGVTTPEGVAVHEAGHQFWYGIVGNNEFEDAWMDEGLNTFSTARALAQAYTPHYLGLRFFGGFVPWRRRRHPAPARDRRQSASRATGARPRATSSRRRRSATGRAPPAPSPTTRPRSGCTRSSGGSAGRRCGGSCRRYFERWKFRHPRPQDFFDVANEVSGRDLTVVLRPGVPQLERLRLRGRRPPHGACNRPRVLRRRRAARVRARKRSPAPVQDEAVVARLGERVPGRRPGTFADGTKCAEHWDGRDRWRMLHLRSAGAGAVGAGRPGPRAAAGRRLHEQLPDARATRAAGGDEVVGGLAGWLQDALLTYGFFV